MSAIFARFVEFFKSLPWYVTAPSGVLGAALNQYAAKILPTWAGSAGELLGGSLALWVALAFVWHAINAWREHNKRPRLQLEPSYIIILGLVIALVGVVWQWRSAPATTGRAKTSTFAQKEQPQYVGNYKITQLTAALDMQKSQNAIVFSGSHLRNNEALNFVLEGREPGTLLKIYATGPDGIKGQQFEFPILSTFVSNRWKGSDLPGNRISMRWGDTKDTEPTSDNLVATGPFFLMLHYCLRIIGPSGEEQEVYFAIRPVYGKQAEGPFVTAIILLEGNSEPKSLQNWREERARK